MKKRIIILSSLITLISLITIFISSIYIIRANLTSKSAEEIKSFMKIAINSYDEENYSEVGNLLCDANKGLRVTFISYDGEVLYDSSTNMELENHLEREEIKNLGKIVKRFSTTLNQEVMYLAYDVNNCYLRLCFNYDSINNLATNYINLSLVIIILVFIFSILLMYLISKKLMKPVNESITKLDSLVNNNSYQARTIDDLNEIIDNISFDLQAKLNNIDYQKSKTDIIINKLDIGIILLEFNKIKLINDFALKTFNIKKGDIYNKSIIYLIRDTKIQDLIYKRENSLNVLELNDKYYYLMSSTLDEDVRFKNGLLLSFIDITKNHKLSLTKRDFFQNASHELKSPLTSIIGYMQLLNNDIISNENEVKDTYNKVLLEANKMNELVINMLDLAHIENKQDLNLENINVKDLIEEIISRSINKLNSKHLNLELNIIDYKILSDRNYLYTLLNNLIDNAIKYNKENGNIIITLKDNYISIKDSGIGIKEEDISRIFERFYRVQSNISGSGLGLAISKHIVDKLGYKIEVKSKYLEYSEFVIYFN